MNRLLARRLRRINAIYLFGRCYKILETWNELELAYNYKPKRWEPFWVSIPELLEKSELKELMNRLLQKKIDDECDK